ncbi:hypothetical protein [Alkalilimnicola sp. S0819]|uniref:hypothetical protein n=1 Tax=Alkalilimnicola sp. S0819 TaxID=2613922 RepID=UPI00126211F7|nr:hypothetical protein [Alkalilimnicola sp. S0819]KAB7623151.1 hypothetical protein F3N43_10150 [Alkalilimnicola sp. S0819]MPQ16995.1 hypothetical protein [Alkalilimnicola sp. S0819]
MLIRLLASALLALALGPASAGNGLPLHYPARITAIQTVDRVDLSENTLVAGDLAYRLDPNLRVHTPATANAPPQALRVGQRVTFFPEPLPDGQELVREIWILPKGDSRRWLQPEPDEAN